MKNKKNLLFILFLLLITSCSKNDDNTVVSNNVIMSIKPYLQNMDQNSVTILWKTNRIRKSWAEVVSYDDEFYDGISSDNENLKATLFHQCNITGLKPGTKYKYRIVVINDNNGILSKDIISQKDYCFTTNDATKATVSFSVLNDVHASDNVITPLLLKSNYENNDFIVYNGDMIKYEVKKEEEVFASFINESIKLFASEKPFYFVKGNHEERGNYSFTLSKYLSPNSDFYYYFIDGNCAFIMLDSGEDKEDSDPDYKGKANFDEYRTKQKAWLEKISNLDEVKNAKHKIVFVHIPPAQREEAKHGEQEVLKKFVPTLNKLKIDLMFSGHFHTYDFIEKNDSVQFPVLINASDNVASVNVTEEKIDLKVIGLNNETVLQKTF